MRIRVLGFLLGVAIALPVVPASAQRTRDRSRLVFTVSGAYIAGRGLWSVPSQSIQDPPFEDNLFLSRSIKGTFGASASGTYFPSDHLGIGGEAFLIGLGYDDACRLNAPAQSVRNDAVCQAIDRDEKSAAAVVLSGGVVFRFASRELISPFVRVNAGILIANQSPIQTEGVGDRGELVVVYDDDKSTRVTPALSLGFGATVPMGKGFGVRWEVRDQIIGIDRITGPTSIIRTEPPHEQVFKHMFSVLIGVDVILERDRGRRY